MKFPFSCLVSTWPLILIACTTPGATGADAGQMSSSPRGSQLGFVLDGGTAGFSPNDAGIETCGASCSSLFCGNGAVECSGGFACASNATCEAESTCSCGYGFTAVDCSGNPCAADGSDCQGAGWRCSLEPAQPFGACAQQSQCPNGYVCDQNGGCDFGPTECLPECDPKKAGSCPNDQGATWCALSSASRLGGLCVFASDCSPTRQDCPMALLDPQLPPGPQNPMVQYTCEPEAPGINSCFPAGTIPLGGSCPDTSSTCTTQSDLCAFGLTCVTLGTGPVCLQQCGHPLADSATPSQASDCPQGDYCGSLTNDDGLTDSTGACLRIPPTCSSSDACTEGCCELAGDCGVELDQTTCVNACHAISGESACFQSAESCNDLAQCPMMNLQPFCASGNGAPTGTASCWTAAMCQGGCGSNEACQCACNEELNPNEALLLFSLEACAIANNGDVNQCPSQVSACQSGP